MLNEGRPSGGPFLRPATRLAKLRQLLGRSLACSAAAPSRLRHALSSVRLLKPLHREQDAHFTAVVIANSLEGALLRVSLSCDSFSTNRTLTLRERLHFVI